MRLFSAVQEGCSFISSCRKSISAVRLAYERFCSFAVGSRKDFLIGRVEIWDSFFFFPRSGETGISPTTTPVFLPVKTRYISSLHEHTSFNPLSPPPFLCGQETASARSILFCWWPEQIPGLLPPEPRFPPPPSSLTFLPRAARLSGCALEAFFIMAKDRRRFPPIRGAVFSSSLLAVLTGL